MIEHLPRVVPAAPGRPEVGGPDHPMRKVTRQVAFEPGGWTPERAAKVAALFDGLAGDWGERDVANRAEALRDALDRGGPLRAPVVEIGAGTGASAVVLTERLGPTLALDLSWEMVRRIPTSVGRLRADSAALPVRTGSAATVVLVNALLFPAEVDRVLAPGGAVVWVNSLGDATPIHLPAADVEAALPGGWTGVASEANWGTWTVLRRG